MAGSCCGLAEVAPCQAADNDENKEIKFPEVASVEADSPAGDSDDGCCVTKYQHFRWFKGSRR
jgi:hypothetical protein